ncbi:hypothetical protein CFE70_006997 [Pyrenophora teres f. teres 0-1]
MTHTYKFNVAMSCGGCSGAIERVLKKLDEQALTVFSGVESFNVSLETQTAEVTAADSLDYETVLEKIKKTGKTVKSGEADGEARDI